MTIVPHLGTFLLAGVDRVAGQRPAEVEGGRRVREYMNDLYYDSITANLAFWDAVQTVGLDHIVFGTDYRFGAGAPDCQPHQAHRGAADQ